MTVTHHFNFLPTLYNPFIASQRQGKSRIDLHEVEARICHVLKHECKVARSYKWHMNSAERQNDAAVAEKAGLRAGEIFLWFDYKQKFSIPQANVASSLMFYGSERMELSVFGILIAWNENGIIKQKNVLYISSIIENSALMTSVLLDHVRNSIDDFNTASCVTCWADCGPHFRCYQVLGHLAKNWFPSMAGRLRVNFFAEKHGKGEIDSMFAHMGRWVSEFLKKKDALIKTPEELIDVCEKGAAADTARDPTGPVTWVVRRFEMDLKPERYYVLTDAEFQISQTYALEIMPLFGKRTVIRWKNLIFADQTEGKLQGADLSEVVVTDRSWRRGYFQSQKWLKKKPEHGEENQLMKKQKAHAALGIDAYSPQCSAWEKKQAAHARRLLLRRQRFQRIKAAANEDSSSSSSSSASSSASEGWKGSACEHAVCDPECIPGQGTCVLPNTCECFYGWGGTSCELPLSEPACVNGDAVAPDICRCADGWGGRLCDYPLCQSWPIPSPERLDVE
eukprot:s456_g5.t1